MEFLQQLESFIHENQLFRKDEKVLLTVSGGVDSVVLAHALHDLGYQFSIAHCNFQLRGSESDADEAFAIQVAKELGVSAFCKKFDTKTLSESDGISIQMAARKMRYDWFEELRTTHGFSRILTAHHQNDSLETILLNLVRGTGIAGLHGIKSRNGYITRPLLFTNKTEIEKYAKEAQLNWREDSSNSNTKYARNLIRNEVVPLLKKLNPSLEQTIVSTTEKIALAESFIQDELEKKKAALIKEENGIVKVGINDVLKDKNSLFLLYSILQEYGFELDTCHQIVESAPKISGKIFESDQYKLIKDRENWLISSKENKPWHAIEIDANSKNILFQDGKTINIKHLEGGLEWIDSLKKSGAIFFDFDQLSFPLKLRKWQQGDKIQPFGMQGSKKVSDVLIDNKLSLFEKEEVLVLESNEKILAIIGLKMSKHCVVDSSTKRIWALYF